MGSGWPEQKGTIPASLNTIILPARWTWTRDCPSWTGRWDRSTWCWTSLSRTTGRRRTRTSWWLTPGEALLYSPCPSQSLTWEGSLDIVPSTSSDCQTVPARRGQNWATPTLQWPENVSYSAVEIRLNKLDFKQLRDTIHMTGRLDHPNMNHHLHQNSVELGRN